MHTEANQCRRDIEFFFFYIYPKFGFSSKSGLFPSQCPLLMYAPLVGSPLLAKSQKDNISVFPIPEKPNPSPAKYFENRNLLQIKM